MFSLFKKNKQPLTDTSQTEEVALDNIEFHGMPAKFRNLAGGRAMPTKKLGLLIVGGGGVILIASAVLLGWYVYQTGGKRQLTAQPLPVAVERQPAETAEALSPSAADTLAEATSTAADLTAVDCGTSLLSAGMANYELDSVLVCLGEKITNRCQPAQANINTAEVGEVKLSVLGERQDKCLVQLDYPDASLITAAPLKIYANTYSQCLYGVNDLTLLNYPPGQLAAYVYNQSGLANLEQNQNCLGSALERAREQARAELAETPPLSAGVDIDNDGLTDVEETAVFTTSVNGQDTDGDGYADGSEVLNLYNPAGAGKLEDSGLVTEFTNNQYGYSLLYPQVWQIEDKLAGESVFFFSGVDGSIQILAQDNLSRKDIKSWYADLVNSSPAAILQPVLTTPNGLELIYSPDNLTAYLTVSGGGSKVFVVTYSPEKSGLIQFKTVLEMMIKSFQAL
ncbi:hypothetical protein A3G56_02860 [Candidatus Falkowbacteria bacterium RIFCSPLOWO2_12_FULL_45_10]|uniref:Uncharacterized protein n=1 Tax=Candidatus Falkowbacteria bacterium RIFCSPLOWO2_12_FULL_45_10 TaxID=1797990 RepID=A0A1F5RVY0_9BACT|nr:MAG: hypothetical protein A3G56_02860 [Candidatus Falkowbacteria bacterium RIFCSPLOWO2_12_FULL_45_10]